MKELPICSQPKPAQDKKEDPRYLHYLGRKCIFGGTGVPKFVGTRGGKKVIEIYFEDIDIVDITLASLIKPKN